MATDAELMAALTFGNNHSGTSAKTVGAAQLARIKTWYAAAFADALNGEAVTSDDIASYLWREVSGPVARYENQVRNALNELAAVQDLTS